MSRIRKDCITLCVGFSVPASDSSIRTMRLSSVRLALFGAFLLHDFRRIRLMDETLGSDSGEHIPSYSSFSRISQAKREPFALLYSLIFSMTAGVDTRGLLPPENHSITTQVKFVTCTSVVPIAPGRMDPVSANLAKILLTHPCDTRSWREMSQGRKPQRANSRIRILILNGRGFPLEKHPPN